MQNLGLNAGYRKQQRHESLCLRGSPQRDGPRSCLRAQRGPPNCWPLRPVPATKRVSTGVEYHIPGTYMYAKFPPHTNPSSMTATEGNEHQESPVYIQSLLRWRTVAWSAKSLPKIMCELGRCCHFHCHCRGRFANSGEPIIGAEYCPAGLRELC